MIDHAIELDFGANGIGGSPNTTAADGYYELDIKLPNGTTAVHHFYRLLGDVTGDGVVDNNDLNDDRRRDQPRKPSRAWTPLNADVTGAGTVTALDLTLATRSKGRKLASGLLAGMSGEPPISPRFHAPSRSAFELGDRARIRRDRRDSPGTHQRVAARFGLTGVGEINSTVFSKETEKWISGII